MAMAFGAVACFSTNFWLAVSCFWIFNMLGAALLPGAFGLMLSAVRPQRTSAASAIAQIPINLIGMAGGHAKHTADTRTTLYKLPTMSGCRWLELEPAVVSSDQYAPFQDIMACLSRQERTFLAG